MSFPIDSIPKTFALRAHPILDTWVNTTPESNASINNTSIQSSSWAPENGSRPSLYTRGGLRSYRRLITKYRFYPYTPPTAPIPGPVVVIPHLRYGTSRFREPEIDDSPGKRSVLLQTYDNGTASIPEMLLHKSMIPQAASGSRASSDPSSNLKMMFLKRPLRPIKETAMIKFADLRDDPDIVFPIRFAQRAEGGGVREVVAKMTVDSTMVRGWCKPSSPIAQNIGVEDTMLPTAGAPFQESTHVILTMLMKPERLDSKQEEVKYLARVEAEPTPKISEFGVMLQSTAGDGALALGYNREVSNWRKRAPLQMEFCRSLSRSSRKAFLHLGRRCLNPGPYDNFPPKERKRSDDFVLIEPRVSYLEPFLAFLSEEDDIFSLDLNTRWVSASTDDHIQKTYQSLGLDLWLTSFPFLEIHGPQDTTKGVIHCRRNNLATIDTTTPLILLSHDVCIQVYSNIPGARYAACLQSWIFPLPPNFSPHIGLKDGPTSFTFTLGMEPEAYGYDLTDKEFGVALPMSLEDLAYDCVCPQTAKLTDEEEIQGPWFYGTIQSRGDLPFDVVGLMGLKEFGLLFDQDDDQLGFVESNRLVGRR